ncbi:putative membrane protein [Geobacillus kaustophilus]|uniref:Putative membrane protein n=1 Tax=Geobacillus kaustophilus TaxID=1462 RepID=A0A0D8C065_GEOKU|nr:putative membrane protein [Geobacillus kaustophilus]
MINPVKSGGEGVVKLNLFSRRLIGLLLACLFMIYLTKLFTMKPHVISGNGNPGMIFIILSALLFFFFGREIWKIMNNAAYSKKKWLFITISSLFILCLSAFLEISYFVNLIKQLGGPPSNTNSKIYRYNWVNQYTNTLYVNIYTFCIFISSVIFVHSVKKFVQK